ncbi:GGDEF domain-containing protein [Vibrio nigripulchritudo]|uniref:GGDEF domain-containing protein n=1 Tax=Vibrio nigripulchritudo TaxID=28173 RepID=UPI0005FA64A1|nr:diguanylate cyclase [Vibrio nigripulchritudo]KJY68577.1 hypothetical protein TW74_25820 [Vibrio nigripulchritudo]
MRKLALLSGIIALVLSTSSFAFDREAWNALYSKKLQSDEHAALMMLQERYIILPDNAEKLYISTQIHRFYTLRKQPYYSELPDTPTSYDKFQHTLVAALNDEVKHDNKAAYAKYKNLINQTKVTHDYQSRALIEYRLCLLLSRMGEHHSAKFYCSSISAHLEQLTDPFIPLRDAYRLLANNYAHLGDYKVALETYFKIISNSKDYHDNSGNYNDIGNLLSDMGRYEESETYLLKSLELRSEPNTLPLARAQILHSLGSLYLKAKQLDKAEQHYQESLQILKKLDHQYGMALTYIGLGQLNTELGHHDLSNAYLHQAMDMAEDQNNLEMKISIALSLANEYLTREVYNVAIEYAETATELAKIDELPKYEADSLQLLSEIQETTGNYSQALESYKRFHELEIQKRDRENQNAFEALDLSKSKLEEELENSKLVLKNTEQQHQLESLTQRDLMNRMFMVVLFLIIGGILYANKRTRQTAEKDSLTHTYNRLTILEKIRRQPQSSSPDLKHVLVLFDLDHFKDINDNYGHPTGDIALKHVAKTISSQLDERDSIGRIGGEEFMVLLTDVPEEQVWVKVEKMRDLIESKTFMSEDHQTLNLTASFSYLSTSEKLSDFDVLYSILDQALYQAKLNGRNCIVDAYTDPIDAIRHSASTPTTA